MESEEKLLEGLKETGIGSEKIYSGRIMDIFRDTILQPDGQQGIREYMKHVGAVCIIPVTENGEVIIERQYRYVTGKVLVEIPAGKLNSADEDRLLAAQRELREETGITASEWVNLGSFYPAPAYSNEYITLYLAEGLSRGEQELDADEFLRVEKISFSKLVEMVMDGLIPDEKTQLAVLKAAKYIERRV